MDIDEEIINTLRSTDSFISGEDLSRDLDISRVAVWKHIEHLRNIGYKIESQHQRGYCFIQAPDKLIAMEVRWGLATKFIARDVIAYDEVSSTNDIAFDLARRGAREGTVVIAETQTAGRGRLDRKWFSPAKKGIWTSIIFYPEFKPVELCQMNLVLGVAIAEAIKKETSLNAELKWPNDIIISKKKAGGILIEISAELDKVKILIAGIGINVNFSERDFTPHLIESASSLSIARGGDIDRISLFRELMRQIEGHYILFKKDGFGQIREKWLNYNDTLGRYIRVEMAGESVYGQAVDIDSDGALMVRLENGIVKKIMSGDIFSVL